MAIPARFIWASQLLDIMPKETILEIGCGTGLLAHHLLSHHADLRLTILDRSSLMLEKATKKNAAFVDNGRLTISNGAFADFHPAAKFDKITAFNVNFFWKGSDPELKNLQVVLKPRGRVFAFFEKPFNSTIMNMSRKISRQLTQYSFHIEDIIINEQLPQPCFCIIGYRS